MSPAGGWSEFLSFHGIIEGNVLLLKYQSNMVFTVKVFGPDGCQMQSKRKDTRIQQSQQKLNQIFLYIYASVKCVAK
jgi:hypothetical protein